MRSFGGVHGVHGGKRQLARGAQRRGLRNEGLACVFCGEEPSWRGVTRGATSTEQAAALLVRTWNPPMRSSPRDQEHTDEMYQHSVSYNQFIPIYLNNKNTFSSDAN